MKMKPALVIYYTIVVVVVVGIALVGAATVSSYLNPIPVAYADKKRYCSNIIDFDEDGSPAPGVNCGDKKSCKNEPKRTSKCVKEDKFDSPFD